MKRIALLVALLFGNAMAQSPSVPREVTSVATLGRWQNGSATGSYRVVVSREGWEHIWSRVFVEWLPDLTDREDTPGPAQVAELVPPIGQGTAVLEATAHARRPGEIVVLVLATSNMELGAKKQRFFFSATSPGVVKLLSRQTSQ